MNHGYSPSTLIRGLKSSLSGSRLFTIASSFHNGIAELVCELSIFGSAHYEGYQIHSL